MEGVVKISDFMKHLENNGFVIVSKDQLLNEDYLTQQKLERRQRELLNKSSVTFKEAIDARLVPVRSKQGIESMLKSGKFKQGEIFEGKDRKRKILTAALKRLRNES